jgi:uncharacterized protein
MLKVDPGLLAHQHRIKIEGVVAADDPMWSGMPWRFASPVELSLDVQEAGTDVVARGNVRATVELPCRRCLQVVHTSLDEDLTLYYRAGLTEVEAQAEEVYAMPSRGELLDLSAAIRENVLLSVPQFALCEEECRGLCPRCGTNLNQFSCDCVEEDEDPRWAALKRLRSE